MRKYELVVIINPDLEEKKTKELIDKIKGWVEKENGKVVKLNQWGKKTLIYLIKKHQNGFYFLLELELEGTAAQKIEKKVKLEEEIIRYLMVRKD